jgi:rsbT co-antagonist protein RsbR
MRSCSYSDRKASHMPSYDSGSTVNGNLNTPFEQQLLVEDQQLYRMLFEHLPLIVSMFECVGENDYRIIGMTPTALEAAQYTEYPIGRLISEFYVPEEYQAVRALFGEARKQNQVLVHDIEARRGTGEVAWLAATIIPVSNDAGVISNIIAISQDVTAYKMREIEQNRTLAELSTPLLNISDNTLVMPLIGMLDSQRVLLMINTLLEGVSESRVQNVIIDITGVPVVDTQVANTLIQAARAVKLLGAQVILSGIRPEVAQILVGLGIDLSSIPTSSSLQSAIASALRSL